MTQEQLREFIEENTIEADISYRGGTLKVDASELFPSLAEIDGDAIVGASQNYLGGGIAGSISGGAMFSPDDLATDKERDLMAALIEECKRYFYDLNNGGGDEYMQENYNSYKRNQRLPVSGY